jgi:hypothetical protein
MRKTTPGVPIEVLVPSLVLKASFIKLQALERGKKVLNTLHDNEGISAHEVRGEKVTIRHHRNRQ